MKYFSRIQRAGVALMCAIALTASFASAPAQQSAPAKRALTHQDYDSWHSIQAPQISRDGKFVAYAYMAQDGDSEIVVRNLATGAEQRAPRGYHPPVPPPDDPGANIGEFLAAQARLLRPVFTADNRFVVFSIEPAKAEVTKAKKEKKKPEDMPKNALGIMDVSSGQVVKIDKVKSFQVPEDGAGFIAYLLEPKPEARRPTDRDANTGSTEAAVANARGSNPMAREGSSPSARASKKKEYGSDLVLRNTTDGTERTFADALDYTLSKDAKTLAFTVASKKEETNGVYAIVPQTDAAPVSLLGGKGKYQKLTWDEDRPDLPLSATVTIKRANNRNSRSISGTAAQAQAETRPSERMPAEITLILPRLRLPRSFPAPPRDFVRISASVIKPRLPFPSTAAACSWERRRRRTRKRAQTKKLRPMKRFWSTSGTGKMITFSQCKKYARNKSATDRIAPFTWLKTGSSCSWATRKWKPFHRRIMASMQLAPTIARIA